LAAAHRVVFCFEQSTHVGRPLLGCRFDGSLWLGRQLKNRRPLILTQDRQQHDLAVRKFERIVMCRYLFFVDLPKIASSRVTPHHISTLPNSDRICSAAN
jgi:hypothetical protein